MDQIPPARHERPCIWRSPPALLRVQLCSAVHERALVQNPYLLPCLATRCVPYLQTVQAQTVWRLLSLTHRHLQARTCSLAAPFRSCRDFCFPLAPSVLLSEVSNESSMKRCTKLDFPTPLLPTSTIQ